MQYLKERHDSSLTVKAFCEKRGLNTKSYYYWQKLIRDEAGKTLSNAIVPVAMPKETAALKTCNGLSSMTIHYGRFSLEAGNNTSIEQLEQTLKMFIRVENSYAR